MTHTIGRDALQSGTVLAPAFQPILPCAPQQAVSSSFRMFDTCYQVCYTRDTHKKRRYDMSFQSGMLRVQEGKASLFSEENKRVMPGKSVPVSAKLAPGAELRMASILIEIEEEIAQVPS